VFLCFNIIKHGGRRGNTAKALAQWQHPVASSEALDVVHWVMRLIVHHHIPMAIKIANNFPGFVSIINFVVAHNRS
jgi:hypothetical protein